MIIIADGVVKAAGYAPIIITKTSTNTVINPVINNNGDSSNGGNNAVVNPNGNTIISNGGQKISKDKEGNSQQNVYKRDQGNGKIFQPDVKIIMDHNNKQSNTQNNVYQTLKADEYSKVIVVTAIVTFIVVMACFGLRMLFNKTKLKLVEEALERHQQIKNVGNENDLKKEEGNRMDSAAAMQTNQSNIQLVGTATKNDGSNAKLYQEQYDPNQDFAIFAAKDQKTGGFIGLKEKMNLADQ